MKTKSPLELSVTCPNKTPANDVLNNLETVSVRALASYAAYESGKDEATVLALTTDHFGVNAIDQIQRKDYEAAIRYLVDLNLHETVH